MAFKHAVKLTLGGPTDAGGTDINVWDGYEVACDMFRVGNPWTFSLWHSAQSQNTNEGQQQLTAWSAVKSSAKLGAPMVFSIDGHPVFTGLIESVTPHHSRQGGAGIVVSGRDGAATPVSWDGDPKINLRNQQLGDVLQRLLATPYSLNIVFGVTADSDRQVRMATRPGSRGAHIRRRTQQVDHTHVRIGEKAWQVAQEICRRLGLLLWIGVSEGGQVNVIIDVPAYSSAVAYQFKKQYLDDNIFRVTDDSNILDGSLHATIADMPTQVNVYGRAPTGDTDDGRGMVTATVSLSSYESATNPGVSSNTLPRIRHKHAERGRTQDQMLQEANRIISDAMKDWRIYKLTVQGHGQFTAQQSPDQTPTLYAINTMAHVRDDICDLDEDMLIHRVVFKGARRGVGQITELILGTKNSVILQPDPIPTQHRAALTNPSFGPNGNLDWLGYNSATGNTDEVTEQPPIIVSTG